MKLTTPKKTSLSIKLFIKNMGLTASPRFLAFTKTSEEYKPSFCFCNCENESKKNNLKTVFGWTIWESKEHSFLEAEFHAVILKNNDLVDITPRIDNEDKILFVPDNTRKAVRYDENTWDSWTPFKGIRGHLVEIARPILRRVDPTITEEYTSFIIENKNIA